MFTIRPAVCAWSHCFLWKHAENENHHFVKKLVTKAELIITCFVSLVAFMCLILHTNIGFDMFLGYNFFLEGTTQFNVTKLSNANQLARECTLVYDSTLHTN